MIVRQPIITAFVYTFLMWSYISLFLYCPSVSYATNIFFSFKIIHRYRYISSQDGLICGKADGETFSKREMLLNAHLSCFADTSSESRASRQTVCRAGSWVHFVFFKMKHSEWKLISLFLGWREGKKVWLHLWCCAGMERATLPNLSREDDKRQQLAGF